jgi:tetratricopeptide (TPR) repeat protein
VLRQGLADNPHALDLADFLADLLASYPDDSIRDGEEAIRWAMYANRRRGGEYPRSMMALATAYAEVGQYDQATELLERALVLAEANGEYLLTPQLQQRLALFRRNEPFRMPE